MDETVKLLVEEKIYWATFLRNHMRHLLETLVECGGYFQQARTHQGIGQLVPAGSSSAAAGRGAVLTHSVLGGLHHDYRRAA